MSDKTNARREADDVRRGVTVHHRRSRFHTRRQNAPAPDASVRQPRTGFSQRTLAAFAGASLLLLLACCAGVSALVVQHMQRETVVFDMKNTIDAFKQQAAQKALDENTARAMTERFSRALNDSLNAYMGAHNDLILVAGAVVQPTLDITPEIQADIARRMQEVP